MVNKEKGKGGERNKRRWKSEGNNEDKRQRQLGAVDEKRWKA